MKMRALSLVMLLALPGLFSSCEDEPAGTPTDRFVYFLNGDAPGSRDFSRHAIAKNADEQQPAEPVVWISDVARNGIVLYETMNGRTRKLWGRCEKGSILAVPLPVASDPSVEFVYGGSGDHHPSYAETFAALAYEGHHAAYFAWRKPVTSVDSTEWNLHLCRFDCGAWEMRMVDISTFLREYYAKPGTDFRLDGLIPASIAISNDGSTVVMELIGLERGDGGPVAWKRILVGGTLEKLYVLDERAMKTEQDWQIAIFDGASGKLFLREPEGSAVVFDCRGGVEQITLPSLGWGFRTLTAGSGELIKYSAPHGILELYRLSDGRTHSVPLTIEKLQSRFPEVRAYLSRGEPYCRVSPDGEWIAFIAGHEQDNGLYIIRRDGTGLQRITRGIFDVAPVVSDVVPW